MSHVYTLEPDGSSIEVAMPSTSYTYLPSFWVSNVTWKCLSSPLPLTTHGRPMRQRGQQT